MIAWFVYFHLSCVFETILCRFAVDLHKVNCCFQVQCNALIIRKGMHSNIESYSAFWDNAKLTETKLRQDLQTRNVTDVFVCGIAYDHCVGEFI